MSENLNRSNPDFSKYDSMSIEELVEILRTDAQGPERADSDVDEILYVMEVLAKKRRQNGIAGKTALEAYQEFQQHYLPKSEKETKPRRKSNIIPFSRIAAVAASLVLVFTLTTTANAFSFRDVWDAVVIWAQETFSFSMGVEVSEPKSESELEYESLKDALIEAKLNVAIPSWIPSEYVLTDIKIVNNPKQDTIVAKYTNQNEVIKIFIQFFVENQPEQVEMSEDFMEIYSSLGTNYYLFSNNDQNKAVWLADMCECYISGDLSIEELKLMIDSIGKG